jgi:beta-phosphoglucomutase
MSDGAPIAFLFDLDGVIVDTAKYHFLAWRKLAEELGFVFTEADNERLKGVSRMRSLEILLEVGGVERGDEEKRILAAKKNNRYLQYVMNMRPDDILPGAKEFLAECRKAGLKTALVSASRNAAIILDLLGIGPLFDAVVDGTMVAKTKPDPEAFLMGAARLRAPPPACAVFEDAAAGIEAAHAAGMFAVGIGNPAVLRAADLVAPGLGAIAVAELIEQIRAAGPHPPDMKPEANTGYPS